MPEQLEASVTLINKKIQFSGVVRDNPAITFDYHPPIGDGQGLTGLEVLLLSLAGCSASTVVYLLGTMKKKIAGLQVQAGGVRRETHPTSLETITLRFILRSADVKDADMQKVIRLAEETYCPVWAMLKGNVDIVTQYEIEKG
ncbi:MAG: OsmC family peroxiredoxin [Deltaproteobacteria bacterium]|nr:OsmC family peroxiredoxin [Deltaproteobacteria bacterium]